ncbi:autotransporter-associated beta strand repeat-containing protein [Akkermansia muciniphila]|uniref:autotransporter-associated beta strand repeat-containing protein n=1 Tax=Akkermansia muciniphila TaxID=239935 RepID=UPI001EE0D3D4|nr:autotransporter outer membrane beta-barrel domain-containing protein [Akkermansia muciniphila]MCG4597608.1 autotransporter-associated beta strand repeat-containing protein [Akkermansia muciniphila]
MKLHLPLNLLAALMTSFSGVTLGTATLAGVSGLLVTASQSYAADVAFDGTQVNVAAGGSASYDVGTVTASTTLNFAGAGTAAITNLNGTAPEAILTVNRVASGGASLSTLTLNGAGTFNGIISLYSNTTGGSQNNILNLNHAQAAQYATIKLGGYGYTTGASVLKAGVNTSISKLEHNNAAALITGEGTTLTITGDSSSYGGSFGGTVTVDYTGGGTFTLGNSDKNTALTPAASPNATLKISRGTLSLFSGNVTWSQKLVMGDGTTLSIQDGPSVTGYAGYNATSVNSGGFNFSGAAVFGTGVNLTSSWGKNVKFSGVLTAASGFSISGGANEYAYYNLLNTANEIGGTIAITRSSASLGIGASGSLGTAAVTTSANSQYLTYYGTAGDAADVIDNSITGAGNFVAQSGWVHLSENVALTGTYTVNSGAVLSRTGSINAALAGGRLDAGSGTMTVTGLSGNGTLSASAGTMHFQDAFTVGETMGILANGSGEITGDVTVDGGRLYYTSMDNVGSVLQNVTLTSGLIDFSGFQEFQDLFGSEALVNTSYNLGVDLGTGFTLADVDESLYTISTVDGKTVITFTASGAHETVWDPAWGLEEAPSSATGTLANQQSLSLYGIRSSSMQEGFGSVNAVTGTGDLTGVTLAGGYYNTATNATATQITTGIWTDVLGGNYNLIIGGSYANNWSGSGKWNVTGDVHTQIQGDTSVNWVVGGNYKDGQAAGITGDVYVSVDGNAVIKGSLIGGGTAAHNSVNNLDGSTHVVVRSMQSVTDETISLNSVVRGFIIGGSAYEANSASRAAITGSTNVTIDLGEASGNFVKSIVGGSYSGGSGAYTIGGDSNVSITAASDAVFTGAVYGGGYSSSGTSTVSGNSSLTLDGGAYAGALYAGGGGTGSSVNGDATLTVKKAVFRTGSTLNASEGTVGGTSSLLLGGYGNTADHAISFSNTAVTGFDIVTMFQDSFFTGNLNMTGSSVLALAGGAGTGINLDGSFSLSAEGELTLDLSGFGTLTDGMSVLSTAGLSNISSIKASFADGVAGSITISDNGKDLVYTAGTLLLWEGGENGVWSAENVWTDGGAPATYADGMAVSFADQAGVANSVVHLDSEVSPSSMLVRNSTTRYELTGTGEITNTAITKEGTGTLVLGTSSILGTGTTVAVSQGILAFGYDTALPGTGVTWNTGSFLGAANGATVTVDLGTVTNPVFSLSPDANSFITLATPSDIVFGNAITGEGTVRKTGTGLLKLTGSNSGHIVVQEGNLQVGNGTSSIRWGSAGSSVTLENGTSLIIAGNSSGTSHHTINSDLILGTNASDAVSLKWVDASQSSATDYQHSFTGTVTVNGAVSLVGRDNWAKEMGFTGTLTGAGSLTYSRGAGDGRYNSNGKLIISGDASGFTGMITMNASNGYSAGLDLRTSVSQGGVTLTSGTDTTGFAFMRVLGDVEIASLDGTENSQVGAVGGARTLTVGAGTYNGTLTDRGVALGYGATSISYDESGVLSLTKVGEETLTLGGTVSYTGLTDIQGGTLALTASGATSLRNITMAANTRMTTAGALNLAANSTLTLDISSALEVGGAFGAGTFNLTLNGLEGITDAGEYTLISAASGLDAASAVFNWAGYTGDETLIYELEQTGTSLKLVVTSAGDVWIWQGAEGETWSDTNTGAMWGIEGSTDTAAGKNLIFNSTGAGTVTLSGAVNPASITVNNAAGSDYVFVSDGAGKIAQGTLTKRGEGKLTLNLDNTGWNGDISVQQGELVAQVANSLGSGAITVTDGMLTLATAEVQPGMGMINLQGGSLNLASGSFATAFTADNMAWTGGSMILGEEVTATVAKALVNGKTVELADGSVLTVSGANDNSALNLNASGTGTVSVGLGTSYGANVLNMSTEFQGILSVTSGYFQLNNVTMGADGILKLADSNVRTEWNGTAGGTFANDVVFTGNQVFATKDFTFSGDLSGTAFSTQGAGNITLAGGVNLDGQLKVHRGTVTVNSANVAKLGDSIDIQNNSTLAFARDFSYGGVISGTAGSTVSVNAGTLELTGANTFLGALSIADGATARLGDGSAWAGSLSGAGSLVIDTAGEITLAAGNTGFTGSTTLSGTGTVTLAGADSLGAGRVTVNNGVLNLSSLDAANVILITKGSLANAEAKTAGNVEVAASAGTQGALNTINLGGLSGSMVGSIVMEDYSRLTGVSGALDMTGKTVTLKLDSGSLTAGGTTGQGVIDADSLTLSAAATTINISNQGVLDLLAANRDSTDGVGLVLTTGTLAVDNFKQIGFSPLLASLGYTVTEVLGADGTLMVSGNTDLVYLVDTTPNSDDPNISDYAALDPYKAVGINGTTLHVSLNGAPEASRNGDGLKVSNLVGSDGALVVTNTADDAASNHAVVDLVQNVDAGGNSYGGTISGDHVDFVKKGAETLTVEGNFTGNDSMLSSAEGNIVLNGAGNSLTALELAGGDITLGGRNDGASRVTTVETLAAGAGGGTLNLGNGAQMVLTGQQAGSHVTEVTISGDGTLTLGGTGTDSSLTLGNGSSLNGVLLDIREGSALSAATGSVNTVSGLAGGGALKLSGAEMTINSSASHAFTGTLDGASGTLNVKSGNGSVQTIKGAGNAGYHLNVSDGGVLTLAGAAGEGGNPAQASYQGITVNGGTLNIGSADDPKTQLTLGSDGLSVTGDSTVAITTSSTTVDGLGNPFVTSSGNITLGDGTGEVTLVMNNLDTLVSGSSETLNMELFKTTDGALVSLGDNVTLQDMILGSMYENLELTTNDSMTAIILTGTARTENIFRDSSLTRNAATGADILWNSRYHMEEGTALRDFYTSVLLSQNSGDYSGAARKLAAAAGSTVTSLGIAQRDSLRDQMGWIRNRVAQMGVNPAYVHEDMPYFHMWMQGTGSYAKLDTRGDESGYELTTWGGTVGMDVDINDRFTAGAAFTANYGSLTASAADTADGDLDSYYVNLFARYQYRKWSHLLILTGGWNDASLTRTVDYGTGSYQARGNTTGSGFGAMYELAYDIALNEDRSVILQPLFNASIVTTRMDGYRESGSAGNAGLKVEDQELTTAAVAVGARLSGLMGSNVFGREALGEVRVNVSQDMGDRRGQANVGFLADPSYTRPVYGAKVGSTAFQIGAGLSVPVGTQGVIFVDGNADIRSGSSSINGSIGYRYNF